MAVTELGGLAKIHLSMCFHIHQPLDSREIGQKRPLLQDFVAPVIPLGLIVVEVNPDKEFANH